MKKTIPCVLTIVAVGFLALPAQTAPAQEAPTKIELEGTHIFMIAAGDTAVNVALDNAEVISVGQTEFLKGVVAQPRRGIRTSYPPGTTLRINMDRVVLFTDPLPLPKNAGEPFPSPEY